MKIFGFNLTREVTTQKEKPSTSQEMIHFNRPTEWGLEWKYDYSKPYVNTRANTQFIPFGVDNAYPTILLEMYYSSPFHSAIVDFKNNSILASGWEIVTLDKTVEGSIKKEKALTNLTTDWLWKFTLEYLIHNRICLEVIKEGGRVKKLNIIGAEWVRESSDGTGYWICEDWIRRRNEAKFIPKWNKTGNSLVEMLVFQRLGPGQRIYSLPQYATASNWIWLDGQVAFFQKQNIENSINPSAIIQFYEPIANQKEKEEFIHQLNRSFTSAKNAGKILTFFSKSKETAPDVTISESNKLDKSFAATQENIVKNVAYAHMINPAILGISTAGQLGATQQLIDAYSIFNSTWLIPTQKMIEGYLTEAIGLLGVNGQFVINKNNKLL